MNLSCHTIHLANIEWPRDGPGTLPPPPVSPSPGPRWTTGLDILPGEGEGVFGRRGAAEPPPSFHKSPPPLRHCGVTAYLAPDGGEGAGGEAKAPIG